MLVLHDEDHVEAGQDGGHEVDVLLAFELVPPAEDGVGSGQHGTPRVQRGGDARLRTPGSRRGQRTRHPGHGAVRSR